MAEDSQEFIIDEDYFLYVAQYFQKNCIRYWVKTNFKWTPEQMAEQATLFFCKGIRMQLYPKK